MWIPRDIEALVRLRVEQRPVVVVTGARQTGKTSLVRRLYPSWAYVSLDLPSEAEKAQRDPRSFLAHYTRPLIIDEVQYAPELFRHLKVVVDQERSLNRQFVLTGSQKFPLMRALSDSLAGRADIIDLEPLSWREVRSVRPDLSVEQFLLRGGFPELHANPDLDADAYYRSYVATYLERDLRQLLQVSQLRDYERFLRACALRSAQLLNKAELARDVGISGSTAAAWLAVLQATGEVALLEPWFSNRAKSLVKSPKLYFGDSGLCAFLCGLRDLSDLHASPLVGALWETLVFSEIRRLQINRRGGWMLNFWRDRSREADFLFHRGGRFDLADAKWTEHPDPRQGASLQRVRLELSGRKTSVDRCALICRTDRSYPLGHETVALPLHDIPTEWG